MALRYAVASGNWSNTATWDGGTLPTSADDVYSNTFTVTIDQNINVLSLRNTAGAPAVAGGAFVVTSSGRTITMTGAGTVAGVASVGVIQLNAPSIALTVAGIISGGATANFWGSQISVASTGSVLNVIGSLITIGSTTTGYAVNNLASSTTVNLTGDINPAASPALRNTIAGTTVNITGNSMGGSAATGTGCSVVGSSVVSVTGNVTGSAAAGISTTATTSPITVNGTVTAGTFYAVDSAGTVTVSSPIVNSVSHNAINSQSTRLLSGSPITYTFKDESGNNKVLYSAGVALGNPIAANVRSGITYGASSELTGTLAVPSPSNVLSGVPTDNTTGTYTTTPEAIATEIFTKLLSDSDFSTSDSFGKLIKDNLDTKSSDIKKNTDLIPAIV